MTSKKHSKFKDIIQIEVVPLPPTLFLQIYFWQSDDHVDLPPSLRIFDKNQEILGFETYILSYHYYLLRVRGTERKTQSPFK